MNTAQSLAPVASTPAVGDGGTIRVGTDLYPCTVVEMLSRGAIMVQVDAFERTDSNGLSEVQEYAITRDGSGERRRFRPVNSSTASGRAPAFRGGYTDDAGRHLTLGERRAYRDPSF